MRYRYKIIWTYNGDSTLHITYVECKCRSLSSAESSFDKIYHGFLHSSPELSYEIVQCECLGKVMKMCW